MIGIRSKTVEESTLEIETAIQQMLDSKAKDLGYDNIVSACSYSGYINDFQAESIALGTWRSLVWKKAYEIQSTATTIPTVDEVIAELPVYEIEEI